MPVRSLDSSVIKWPSREEVKEQARGWAQKLGQKRDEVIKVGMFGSAARGDWGVGSDLDLLVILEGAEESFERRGIHFDTTDLPVPTDLLVYTQEEWEGLKEEKARFYEAFSQEGLWLWSRY